MLELMPSGEIIMLALKFVAYSLLAYAVLGILLSPFLLFRIFFGKSITFFLLKIFSGKPKQDK